MMMNNIHFGYRSEMSEMWSWRRMGKSSWFDRLEMKFCIESRRIGISYIQ